LQAAFESDQSRRTKRAATEKRNSWWEGVINLPTPTKPISEYYEEIGSRLKEWCEKFEKLTGQSVRHIEVHLDEGYLDESNKPVYNAHAHVLACRLSNEENSAKLLNPTRAGLSKLQDITADTLQMQRGETLASRNGIRGRKHTHHADFRRSAEHQREQQIANKKKVDDLSFELFNTETELQVQEYLAQQDAKSALEASFDEGYEVGYGDASKAVQNDLYGFLRGYLKGTKQATQSDYQTLKSLNDMNVDLSSLYERAESNGSLVFEPLRFLSKVLSNFKLEDKKTAAQNVLRYSQEELNELQSKLLIAGIYGENIDNERGNSPSY